MDTKRYIGRGNNLGNTHSQLGESARNDLYYHNDIQSIIDRDWTIKLAIVRSLGLEPHLQSNPDYIRWENSSEADDASPKEFFEKRLQFSNGKYDDIINAEIYKLKTKYHSMFSTIDTMFQQAEENGAPQKIYIDDNYADLGDNVFLEHRIPLPENSIELDNRRELGILASEWFGTFEKFGECRFCSSFTAFSSNKDLRGEPNEKSISFIIDTHSKYLQKLLHLDYFRFQRCRKNNNLSSYTSEELKFLNQLDEWSNPTNTQDKTLQNLNGKSGEDVAHQHPNWMAIPGGIPSKYITGIMLHGITIEQLNTEIRDALQRFNCPILNESYNVVDHGDQIDIQDEIEL